jgi:hypothetical protein
MIAKRYDMDAGKTASHLCLKLEQIQTAMSYYQSYPSEINQALEENHIGEERLRQMFPNLRVFTRKPLLLWSCNGRWKGATIPASFLSTAAALFRRMPADRCAL